MPAFLTFGGRTLSISAAQPHFHFLSAYSLNAQK